MATRPRSGRPHALDAADLHTLERISEEAGGYVTWERFAEKFNEETGKNVCAKTVYSCCKEAGRRTVCERYVSCLNTKDMERRLEWAHNHFDYEWIGTENCRYAHVKQGSQVGWVDIDEKWFELQTRRMLKLPEGMTRTRCPVQSRKYMKKVMDLSVLACPCGDFDGRVGLYRVARDREALRDSKYHKRGDVYKVD